ncbi:MAG: peptidylprolyl isomerase [Phycisphaerae bacterium]|nr:peptidylprolyl isomerase [Phycisphaerae bacterium]
MAVGLSACETPPTQGPRPAPRPATSTESGTAGASFASPRSGDQAPASSVASWRGRSITWDDLRPGMTEVAGATVLKDAFLDFRIEQALAERKQTVDAAAIARERVILVTSLDVDPNIAERLLEGIRQRQGLGPTRFEALLRRNAGLRALVAAEIRITPDALARQHEIMHGSKRVCRVVSVRSLQEADALKRQIDAGANIADIASRHSTDASAARGGLLAPIARPDPTWPQAFRDALFALAPNEVAPATLVGSDYVVIQFIEERPSDGISLESARSSVEETLRRTQERVLMEEKARAFLNEIQPSIYDTALDQAWRRAGS